MEREAPLFLEALYVALCGPLWLPVLLCGFGESPSKSLKNRPRNPPKSPQIPQNPPENGPKSTPKRSKIEVWRGLRFGSPLGPLFFLRRALSWGRLGAVLGASWGVLRRLEGVLAAS